MLGLEKEIINRRKGKKSTQNEKFSYRFIANLLGEQYMKAFKKTKRKAFRIEEAIAIFKSIIPEDKQTLDYFIYLFTDQN